MPKRLRVSSRTIRKLLLTGLMAVMLAGCASNGPPLSGLPERVELNGVPFFRGNANQSAAMALASVLSQQGIVITPGLLEPDLHLSQGLDRLEGNMQEAARDYGMVVYPLEPELAALLVQVSAGYPVLLRYTEGSAFWAEPRYALLVGFDRYKRQILLRSGMNRRLPMGFNDFMSAWKDAGAWAVLVQAPGQLPAQVDRQRWLQAADALAQAGQEQAAAKAVKAVNAQ